MYCPKCNGEMGMRDARCPHCGYAFDAIGSYVPPRGDGFAYSPFANFALAVGIVAAVIACVAITIGGPLALLASLREPFFDMLVNAFVVTVSFMLCFSNLIVLLRVYEMKPRK